ncbi:MAG: DUF642 domain-containing protein [Verrucomicrobiota bacterium]
MKSATFLFFFIIGNSNFLTSANLPLQPELLTAQACVNFGSADVNSAPGQKTTVTVKIPASLNSTNDASVRVISRNPGLAAPAGAVNGVLTLNFVKGGPITQSFDVDIVGKGGATLELANDLGVCVGDPLKISARVGFVRNPSFELNYNSTDPHYVEIDAWTKIGGGGVNEGTNGPFADNGTIPDRSRVGFIQGTGSIAQNLSGLEPGKQYWIQYYFNARGRCGGTIDATVKFNDADLDTVSNVRPVGGARPYNFRNVLFTPGINSGELKIATTAQGDATVVLDAISIVQRDAGNLIVQNPSFEASGDVPSPGYLQTQALAGWTGTGQFGVNLSGGGPFADNGTNPDQDNVAFIQGQGASLSQTIGGLTPGQSYVLSFAVNARGGNSPHLQVDVNSFTLIDENVTAVGGNDSYLVKTVVFTATGPDAEVKFEQTATGDNTLLLDDISINSTGITPPQPVSLAITLQSGGNVRISWPASATGYLLESTSSFPGGWTDVNLLVTVDLKTDQNFVTVSTASSSKFYRLRK